MSHDVLNKIFKKKKYYTEKRLDKNTDSQFMFNKANDKI